MKRIELVGNSLWMYKFCKQLHHWRVAKNGFATQDEFASLLSLCRKNIKHGLDKPHKRNFRPQTLETPQKRPQNIHLAPRKTCETWPLSALKHPTMPMVAPLRELFRWASVERVFDYTVSGVFTHHFWISDAIWWPNLDFNAFISINSTIIFQKLDPAITLSKKRKLWNCILKCQTWPPPI